MDTSPTLFGQIPRLNRRELLVRAVFSRHLTDTDEPEGLCWSTRPTSVDKADGEKPLVEHNK